MRCNLANLKTFENEITPINGVRHTYSLPNMSVFLVLLYNNRMPPFLCICELDPCAFRFESTCVVCNEYSTFLYTALFDTGRPDGTSVCPGMKKCARQSQRREPSGVYDIGQSVSMKEYLAAHTGDRTKVLTTRLRTADHTDHTRLCRSSTRHRRT